MSEMDTAEIREWVRTGRWPEGTDVDETLGRLCDALDTTWDSFIFHVGQEARAVLEHMETRKKLATAEAQIVTLLRQCDDESRRAEKAQARGDIWKQKAVEIEGDRDRLHEQVEKVRALCYVNEALYSYFVRDLREILDGAE